MAHSTTSLLTFLVTLFMYGAAASGDMDRVPPLDRIMNMKALIFVIIISVALLVMVLFSCRQFYGWWRRKEQGYPERYKFEFYEDTTPLLVDADHI